MDAVLLAAAVSVAVDAQRAAELAAEERERYAMRAADLECLVAQRMFMEDLLLPQRFQPITYERAYTLRHMLLRGRVSRALQVAEEELGEPPDAEDAESESLDNDEPVDDPPVDLENVQTALLEAAQAPAPAAPVQAFSGRCFQLDDA